MTTANEVLRVLYLDYVNNYLTLDTFAEHNGLTATDARRIISMGKVYHEDYVKSIRFHEAKQFFYEHAGWGYNPKTETPEQGRQKCAILLATAEYNADGFVFNWEIDADIDSSDFRDDIPPYDLWCCDMRNESGDILGSLAGVDFGPGGTPDGQPYKRVVEAEIAQEYFNSEGE